MGSTVPHVYAYPYGQIIHRANAAHTVWRSTEVPVHNTHLFRRSATVLLCRVRTGFASPFGVPFCWYADHWRTDRRFRLQRKSIVTGLPVPTSVLLYRRPPHGRSPVFFWKSGSTCRISEGTAKLTKASRPPDCRCKALTYVISS